MLIKLSKPLAFILAFIVAILVTFFTAPDRSGTRIAVQENSSDCSRIASIIQRLRSPNDAVRAHAKKVILSLSSRSESSRQCAIQNLLSIAAFPTTRSDKALALFLTDSELYFQWMEAVDILGEMRATEAIDTLIDCLNCNDGRFSLGLGHFPAALSLIKFGDQAVPKLEAALREKQHANRYRTVLTLAAIGGEKVKSILSETLKTETDRSVIDAIKNIMLSWNVSSRRKG
jgi:HEAT repeat protein